MFSLVKEELVNEDLVTGESVNKELVNDELLKEEPVIEEVVTEEQVWLFTLLFVACRRSHIQHTEMLVHPMKMESRCFMHVQTPRVKSLEDKTRSAPARSASRQSKIPR